MIRKMHSSIKKTGLWCLIVTCGIVSICFVFISFVSLGTGFTHMQQDGFWVPVLAGALLLSAALFLFVRATKRILFHMKEDALNI
jgi:cell shape-determining protein MreD